MNRRLFLLQKLSCGLPAYFPDLPLQLADTCLACIGKYDFPQRPIADSQLLCIQAVLFQLLCDQMLPGDVELFIGRIACHFNDFHAV